MRNETGHRSIDKGLSKLGEVEGVNGTNVFPNKKILEVEKLTLYPNGYININQNGEYTKHYYADAARIASKIGSGYNTPISYNADNSQSENALEMMKNELGVLTGDSVDNITHSLDTISYLTGNGNTEDGLFFYHGNHLSSTQLITDINANISQAVLYTPWGSVIKEYKADWMLDTIPRYLFNAKEKDEESGLYYYEARYYSDEDIMFTARDPLFEKYPFMSPYSYCMNNPVILVDPTGMEAELGDYYTLAGKWLGSDGNNNDNKAYTATAKNADGTFANANELPIKNSELLDRATWVHGESGGSSEVITNRTQNAGDASTVSDARVADYYASAINNISKAYGNFYKGAQARMSKKVNDETVNTSSGYFSGTGIGGNVNSKAFANARQQGMESLMGVSGAATSISAVINSISGGTDPTGGARAWLGGNTDAGRYVGNPNIRTSMMGQSASHQFSFSSGNGKFFHTFYRIGK